MTFDDFKKEWVGKKVRETISLWYQCVALVKHYAKLVDGNTLKKFWWSAIQGRESWSPFVGLPYTRVFYHGKWYPPKWSIVFFDKTETNKYWHTAIAWQSSTTELRVIEQNAIHWTGLGNKWDEISIRSYPYKWGKTGNVLWWFTCNHQF